MSLVLCDGGEAIALKLFTNKISTPENLVLRLFTSNTTPAKTDTVSTYTETSGFGYAAVTLTGSSWTTSGANPTTISYPMQTFTFTGALGMVYGYYLTRVSSADLVIAERFASPISIVSNGDSISITLHVTLT